MREITREIYEREKKRHKKCLTSLEIYDPVARESFFSKYVVHQEGNIFYCKHNGIKEIREIYSQLKHNFEIECGDLARYCDPDTIYLIVFPLLDPGLISSKRYKYVAIIEVHEGIIQFVWLHPYLRNKGFMKNFFLWYVINENMLTIAPPVSKSFQGCMNSVQKLILEDKEMLNSYFKSKKKWFKKHSPEVSKEIELLTVEELQKVQEGMETYQALYFKNKDKGELQTGKVIEMLVKLILNIKNNPDFQREIQDWCKDQDGTLNEEIFNLRKDFRNYGVDIS